MTKLQQAIAEVNLNWIRASIGSGTILECLKEYGFTGPFVGLDKYYDNIYELAEDLSKEI